MAKNRGTKANWILFFTMILLMLLSFHDVYAEVEGDFEYEVAQDYSGKEVVNITNYIGTKKEVTIPDEIDNKPLNWIMNGAFQSKGLTKVDIGANVTYIGYDAFSDNNIEEVFFGENFNSFNLNPTFANNPLKKIVVDENNPNFKSVNEKGLYRKNFDQNTLLLGTISGEIANNTEVIGNNAFFGIPIKGALVIPDSVETIQSQAFYNSNVKSVEIGKGLKNLNHFVFSNNPLETIIVNSENQSFKDINNKGIYSKDGTELKQGTISGEIAEGTVVISRRSFSSINVKEIVIPNSVQIIDKEAFTNTTLERITFPKKVSHDGIVIESGAFAGGNRPGKLKGLEIPESVKKIEYMAFENAIESGVLTIKGAREGIGIYAFARYDEKGIEEVNIETDFDNNVTTFPSAFVGNNIRKIVMNTKMDEYTPNGDFFNNPVEEIFIGKDIGKLNGELIDKELSIKVYGFSNLFKTNFYQDHQKKHHFIKVDSPADINILHDGKVVKEAITVDAQSDGELTMDFHHEVASIKNIQWKVDGKYIGGKTSLELSPYTKTLNEKTITLIVETEYGAITEKKIKLKIKPVKEMKPETSIKGSVAKVSDDHLYLLEEKGLLNIDLSNEAKVVNEIKLTKGQVGNLIEKKAVIQIKQNNVILNISAENFQADLPVSITIKRLEKNNKQFTNGDEINGILFEFSIKQGDKFISSFTKPVELMFSVAHIDDKNREDLKVYYWNEENKEWELIGGKYQNGYIHALTDHFSVFGLFHPEEMITSMQEINEDLKAGVKQKSDGQLLPKTATNNYKLLFIGTAILLIGGLIYFRFGTLKFSRNKN